ncbi:MAG: pyridoxal-phosphate dependent enzyme, partial [Rhodospirillaceae bacterium]|nr:pyridoxal-phosphate dependent enzyme [Rhodospirillaceae bacterium]
MTTAFDRASLAHVSGTPHAGNAASSVISPADFAAAIDEIMQWDGYAATPLVNLRHLAAHLSLEQVLYKDEGPRFGLGSFKALGGSYAALRVLQRQISGAVGHAVSLADIRAGKYADEAAKITLISATDGNHGRAVAWGCQRFGAPCRIYI